MKRSRNDNVSKEIGTRVVAGTVLPIEIKGVGTGIYYYRRGDGIEPSGSQTGEWIVHFWYRDNYGLDARLIITEESSDAEIREAIINQIEPPARALREEELGGKIEDFQAND